MDFEQDISAHVLSTLPFEPNVASELKGMNARQLLIVFRNWLSRQVAARVRRAHQSAALSSNPLSSDPAYKPALDEIVRRLGTGEELTPFLSRGIRFGFRSSQGLAPGQLQRRKDLDLLLNEWRIHHLHLSTTLEADAFMARTGPLLFAIFTPDDAYLIDILEHGGWYNDALLKIVAAEWPNAGLVEEIPAKEIAFKNLSEEDRKALRSAGVNSTFEYSGRFYQTTSAVSTAGTSSSTILAVQEVFRRIRWFENELQKDPDFVIDQMRQSNVAVPAQLDLHFGFFDNGGYGVVEANSSFRFRLHA
jgi:hypothetical protein